MDHRNVSSAIKAAGVKSTMHGKALDVLRLAEERVQATGLEASDAWEGLYHVLKEVVGSDPVAKNSSIGRALLK